MLIYMVELEQADHDRQAEWERWHEAHTRKLTTVPGILSAQRFRSTQVDRLSYLALYGIESLSVLSSKAYLEAGSPPSASAWHSLLRNWRRNVAETPGELLAPALGECVEVLDRLTQQDPEIPSNFIRFLPLAALDRSFTERGIRMVGGGADAETFDARGRRFEAISEQIRSSA